MIAKICEYALFLHLASFRNAFLDGGGWDEFGVKGGDAFVNRMPGLLNGGECDAQFVGEILISSAQERGQQQTLLAGREAEARRLVRKESARPSS